MLAFESIPNFSSRLPSNPQPPMGPEASGPCQGTLPVMMNAGPRLGLAGTPSFMFCFYIYLQIPSSWGLHMTFSGPSRAEGSKSPGCSLTPHCVTSCGIISTGGDEVRTVCQLELGVTLPSKLCQRWAHTQKMHKCVFQLWKGILALSETHCPLLVLLRYGAKEAPLQGPG